MLMRRSRLTLSLYEGRCGDESARVSPGFNRELSGGDGVEAEAEADACPPFLSGEGT